MSPLPPDPKIRLDSEAFALINQADKHLNFLDGALSVFPANNPFASILTIRESVHSNLIDGNKYSLMDLYKLPSEEANPALQIINNTVSSHVLGQKLLKDVSSSSHIIRSIHKELYRDPAGGNISPGALREVQVAVTPYSEDRSNVKYLPPPAQEIPGLMDGLQQYIASNISYPVLVNAALIHAQFEMIHPFAGGNGIVGRILFQIHLLWKKRLSSPVLQISEQLNKKRGEYFDRLGDLERNGNWEPWIKFFLRCVIDAAANTMLILQKTAMLERRDQTRITEGLFASASSMKFFNLLFNRPIVSLSSVTKELGFNKQTANVLISKFLEEKMILEITGQQRNRLFAYKEYLDILNS